MPASHPCRHRGCESMECARRWRSHVAGGGCWGCDYQWGESRSQPNVDRQACRVVMNRTSHLFILPSGGCSEVCTSHVLQSPDQSKKSFRKLYFGYRSHRLPAARAHKPPSASHQGPVPLDHFPSCGLINLDQPFCAHALRIRSTFFLATAI
jgi:hypothetical protein